MKRWMIVAVLVLLGGLGLGASIADNRPATMHFAQPEPGDTATYSVSHVRYDNRWAPVPFDVLTAQAQWLSNDHLSLRADYHFWASALPYSSAVYLDADYGSNWVRLHENFPEIHRTTSGIANIVIANSDQTLVHNWVQADTWDQMKPPCGFRPNLPSVALEPGTQVNLGGTCHNLQVHSSLFEFVRIEEVAGMDTARFQNVHDPWVTLWYNPGIPFPVQVRDHFTHLFDPGKTNGHVFLWTLDGYERTDVAAAPASVPQPDPVATTDGVGEAPDEAGTDHPFSLQTAIQYALDDDASLASFVARPNVYLSESHHWNGEDETGRASWQWKLIWTDGASHRDRVIWWEPQAIEDGAALLGPNDATVRVAPWDSGLPSDVTGLYPLMDDIPTTFPRLDDAFQRATELTGEEPDWWETRIMCHYGNCDRLRTWMDVGRLDGWRNDPDVPDVAGVLEQPEGRIANIRILPNGTVIAHGQGAAQPSGGLGLVEADGAHTYGRTIAPAGNPAIGTAIGAAGAATLLAAALAAAWPVLKPALIGGFSRITQASVLRNPQRAVVNDLIQANPGLHFQQIVRRSGFGAGAVEHHLGKLTDTSTVQAIETGGYTCFFPAGEVDHRIMVAQGVIKAQAAREVLAHLQSVGHGTARTIAAAVGISPGTASHHLRRLLQAGLLEGGGRRGYQPTELARQVSVS